MKRMNFPVRKDQRKLEAEERAKVKAKPGKLLGLKEKVKQGVLTSAEALDTLRESANISPSIWFWLEGRGARKPATKKKRRNKRNAKERPR
jgi:hypothetical protein